MELTEEQRQADERLQAEIDARQARVETEIDTLQESWLRDNPDYVDTSTRPLWWADDTAPAETLDGILRSTVLTFQIKAGKALAFPLVDVQPGAGGRLEIVGWPGAAEVLRRVMLNMNENVRVWDAKAWEVVWNEVLDREYTLRDTPAYTALVDMACRHAYYLMTKKDLSE